MIVVTRTGADVPMKDGRDIRYSDVRDRPRDRLRAGDHERRGPAVHPLHLGLDRKAQGRRPHHRRLCGVGGDDLRLGVRLPARTTSSGAPPTSAGSPATATSSTARSAMGATSVMFDGVPNYPDFGRFWETIDRLGVTIFYTAPTAIRALDARGRRAGEAPSAASRCACSAPSASRSTPKPGNGIGAWSAIGAARWSTPGGRPRPAAS